MSAAPPAPTRTEIGIVVLLVVLAAVIRGWAPGALGVDHFDEGVYVFSALGLTDGDQPLTLYPNQLEFSPPVHFTLVGLGYLLAGGASPIAAVFVSVLAGALTVAALWGFLRRTFGPAVAVAAAAWLTFDTYHVSLCRTALTDATFALTFVLALWAACAALERASLRRAMGAGLLVALAWNTKYHGWFAAMICAPALLCWWFRGRTEGASFKRLLLTYATLCGTAVAAYLPWALFVQSTYGYRRLMAYQKTNLKDGYLANLTQQAENLTYLAGPLDLLGIGAALAAALLVARDRRPHATRTVALLVGALAVAALAGGPAARLVLALAGVAVLLVRPAPLRGWALLGWTGVFFFSAPLYFPYARLLLPLDLAMTALAALALVRVALVPATGAAPATPHRARALAGAALGLAALVAGLVPRRADAADPWRPADGAAQAAADIATTVPAGVRTVVLGEPCVAFHLHLLGRPSFERVLQPDEQLADTTETVYVAAGLFARIAPQLRDGLLRLGDRLVKVRDVPLPLPKDHRLLDDFGPERARTFLTHPDDHYRLELYRLDPVPARESD